MENNNKIENISLRELATRIGINDFDSPTEYDISGENYEILSYDVATGKEVWKPIINFVVKPSVKEHYQLNTLHGTGEHRIYSSEKQKYVALKNDSRSELVKQKIQVVDVTVADTNCYVAEGQINHNTTPGGMSIPYICSTRLRITSTGQSKIEDSKGNIIGIKVKAKTIKNKVAKPFRECEFQILFGQGIREHEEVFDLFREYCSTSKEKGLIMPNGYKICIEGTGAWKNFLIHDEDGVVIEDVKFYKAEFGDKVLYKPEYSQYMEALFEETLIIKSPSAENMTYVGPDMNSIEETVALTRNSKK